MPLKRSLGSPDVLPSAASPIIELIADGITVSLFALGTLRGISAGLDF